MLRIQYNPAEAFGCGIVCQPEKEDLLNGVLRAVALSEDEYQQMCDGAKRAAEKYDFANLTKDLLAVIESCN